MQISHRAASFPESVIREMTRQHALYGGVNLAQAYPDFDPPPEIIEAAAEALERAFTPRTRPVIVNTPHNPTGKVFNRAELEMIADLCIRHDALAVTDEIYERILYDGREHISLASLPGMLDRTVTISGLSK